jgi:hypothetical protein
VTAALREACSEAGASFPYVTAAQVLNDLCGAQISSEHVRRLTNRVGSQEAVCQAAEAKAVVEPSATQVRKQQESEVRQRSKKRQEPPALLLVGLDGGWIKSREQERGFSCENSRESLIFMFHGAPWSRVTVAKNFKLIKKRCILQSNKGKTCKRCTRSL